MTQIKRLTQILSASDDDIIPLWDSLSGRTRGILASTLKSYTSDESVVDVKITDNHLILTKYDGTEIDVGVVDHSSDVISSITPNHVPVMNQDGTKLIDSSISETAENVIINKTLIVPQESILIGPAVKLSDKGGNLGVSNLAEDKRGFAVVSDTYETEYQRDSYFSDGVPVVDYEYLVPAKWVYQFPFSSDISDNNLLSFEFEDSDDTFIRKFRLFSTAYLSGVRIWIENLLDSGDKLVWENVSKDSYDSGGGATLVESGITEIETGFIKISTANIRFRFNIQAQPNDVLNIVGSSIDLGFGLGFYPKMYTYTQDSKKVSMLDAIDTMNNRFGGFKDQLRLDADNIIARYRLSPSDTVIQPDYSSQIASDRPKIAYTNGSTPITLNSVTVKHQGTWGPVQVSFSDLRTTVVDLAEGENTIPINGKPLVIEANEDFYITFSGAVGEGSQNQISLLGDESGNPYASINTTDLHEKNIVSSITGEVKVDGNETSNIVTGKELSSTYEASTATVTLNVTPPDVVILDASIQSSFSIDENGAGETYKIIASTSTITGIPVITVSPFSSFDEGSIIKFVVDDSYTDIANYVVVDTQNYNLSTQRRYLNTALGIRRADYRWIQISSADSLAAGIGGLSELSYDSVSNGDIKPIKAIIFTTDPSVEFESQEGGNAVKIDLTMKQNAETSVNFDADIENVEFHGSNLNNAGEVAANAITIPNTNNISLGSTKLRSYQNTTMICEADNWQWKDLEGNHTATISDEGLNLNSSNLLDVTDIKIDNSGTTSIYSSHNSEQSINFFNMGGLSLGADNGETIDFGFNGVVKQAVSESGIDMGGTNITSLNDGIESDHAATCGQTMISSGNGKYDAKGDKLTAVSGIEFSSNGNSGNYADLGFQGANSRLRFFTSDSVYMTIGTESYASFDIFSSATQTYSFGINEFDMLNKPIKNLANGQSGNDAVNYSQLMTYQAGNTSYKVDSIAMGTGMTAQLNNDHQLTINAPSAMSEENQLLAGIAGGQLFVNEITVG